ncbi:N-formylglutamate amidohydrolase [Novipirellula aureliae]|nr:N-formylglutamate amidohydrolase [Novipirellula aureliae]
MSVIISCETGGDRIPDWLSLSPGVERDAGILPLHKTDGPARYAATRMAAKLNERILLNEYSAGLVDVTRSIRHRSVFPVSAKKIQEHERKRLIEEVHVPYRERLKQAIADQIDEQGYSIHLSVRSFSLRKNGKLQRTDVGLLYDPAREDEVDFCLDWIDEMYADVPMVRVRRNYPRRGTVESIHTAMRTVFADHAYLGIEVLLNRAWAAREVYRRDEAIDGIARSLCVLLDDETETDAIAYNVA